MVFENFCLWKIKLDASLHYTVAFTVSIFFIGFIDKFIHFFCYSFE